jgi:hypothetical protein
MINKTFVGVFAHPLEKGLVSSCVVAWAERYESIEQLVPDPSGHSGYTLRIKSAEEIMWEQHLTFRVSQGGEFSWVYITLGNRAMETTGLPSDDIALCLEVLIELPHLTEVVRGEQEKRLDELEALGWL